jgi:hypothetical protein
MEAKKAILVVMVAAVLGLAFDTFTQAQEITEKPDPALGVTLFAPRKATPVAVEKARFNLGHVRFRVYPILYQSLNKSEKAAVLQIDIQGLYKTFNNARLVINIDGQTTTTTHLTWDVNNDTIFRDSALTSKLRLFDATGSFNRIANAKDVYLTVLLPGETPDRYSVHLASENLEVFKTMLSKYDALEPHAENR